MTISLSNPDAEALAKAPKYQLLEPVKLDDVPVAPLETASPRTKR